LRKSKDYWRDGMCATPGLSHKTNPRIWLKTTKFHTAIVPIYDTKVHISRRCAPLPEQQRRMTKRLVYLSYVLAALSLSHCANIYECENFRSYLEHEAHGTVTDKYLDSTSHMWPTIVYETIDGKKGFSNQIGMYVPAVFDTLEIGDMLDKSSGSTMVTLTKRGRVIELDTAKETRTVWCKK